MNYQTQSKEDIFLVKNSQLKKRLVEKKVNYLCQKKKELI